MTKRLLKILSVLIVLAIAALIWTWWTFTRPPVPVRSQGPNAVWLAHRWAGDRIPPAEYLSLAQQLQGLYITDAYFHVGPMDATGHIPEERRRFARTLVYFMKKAAPDLRLHAWIGQVEKRGGGPFDLADPVARQGAVDTARLFLDLGFDGIHYNIEPISSGDTGWLDLLEETAAITRPRGKLLSISGDEIEIFPGADFIARMLAPRGRLWSRDYYRQVAQHCDQIAVMTYDTAMPSPWLYRALMAWQTRLLQDTIDPRVTLFIGIPTYEDHTWAFDPFVENMYSGLAGILWTLNGQIPARLGTAIYAHWTTDKTEWEMFRLLWLGGGSEAR
ncbi:MAG: glycoside hydrolase family 18 protein [Pseudomonadota bacterium]|nr:glycoside hydrolase family 18 protein [Pseudomonadota bacterium]